VTRLGGLELVRTVLDDCTWVGWDDPPRVVAEEGSTYAAELAAARAQSGADESIVTGEGRIRGRRVAVVAGEFRFLAGSIGSVAAERIVTAFERARAEQLPLFAAPASGGTRMQEGTPAFVAMVKISAACAAFREAGLPYLVYLRHPTTGGVLASWASLGHVTVAEPGATIGFLGARVYEVLYGHPFPTGVQTARTSSSTGSSTQSFPQSPSPTWPTVPSPCCPGHARTCPTSPSCRRSHWRTCRRGSRSPARAATTDPACAPC